MKVAITYNRGYKYRIADIPANEPAKSHIRRNGGCSRKVYNLYVDSLFSALETAGYHDGILPRIKLPEVTAFKKIQKYEYLKKADSLALSNAKLDFEAAVKRFNSQKNHQIYRDSAIRRQKNGGKELTFRDLKGMPGFHSKKINRYSYTTNNQTFSGKDTIRLVGNKLHVPKLKDDIVLVLHRKLPIGSVIKGATLSMEPDGSYYVSLKIAYTRETDISTREYGLEGNKEAISKLSSIGLDYSQDDFYVDNAGRKPNCPHAYLKSQEKLARYQKRLSRMIKGSAHYNEMLSKIRNLHVKIANQRLDFCHQESRYMANTYDFVSVEDIDLRAMGSGLRLGRKLHDNGFGMFRTFIDYKLQEKGSLLIKVPRYFASSKTCSNCGNIYKDLSLSDRDWICPICGTHHDRDHNAGINIKSKGYEVFAAYVSDWKQKQDKAEKGAIALHNARIRKKSA